MCLQENFLPTINTGGLKMGLKKHLDILCNKIGERHLGSEGEKEAQKYIEEQFKEIGYEVVRENFSAPSWNYGRYFLKTEDIDFSCFPCFYSNSCDIKGQPVIINPKYIEDYRGRLKGKICIIFEEIEDVNQTNKIAKILEDYGAGALVIVSPYENTYSTKIVRNPDLRKLGVLTVSKSAAKEIIKNIKNIFHLKIEGKNFTSTSYNIVGRYKGKTDRKVVIGAHYDTAPGCPGAWDNGTGVSILIELARYLKDKDIKYSIDFVAFGGEEYGGLGYGLGGYEYFKRHSEEKIVFMGCLDEVGAYFGRVGCYVGKSNYIKDILKEFLSGSDIDVYDYKMGSDHNIFNDNGIPNIWFTDWDETTSKYFHMHSPEDNLEIIDIEKLKGLSEIIFFSFEKLLNLEQERDVSKLEFFKMKKEDFKEVENIVKRIWTMGGDKLREDRYGIIGGRTWEEWVWESVKEYLEEKGTRKFVTKIDGKIAGFCSYTIDKIKKIGTVGYNGVSPEYSGLGIGTYQMNKILELMKKEGMEIAEVLTGLNEGHTPARKMYEKVGFKEFSKSILYTKKL